MNNTRRKLIKDIITALQGIDLEGPKSDVENVKDEEQEAFDNLPESLQQGDRGQAMEQAIGTLEDALSELETACSAVEDAIAKLEEIE